MKGKGESQRYTRLNTLQRGRRRNKKDFLKEQCKVIEENNRIRKTRDLIKKIRGIKVTFYACKEGHYKKQKWQKPNRSREIKKSWQEYTELNSFNSPDNDNGGDHSPRVRHPGVWSQVGLRKKH